VKRYSQFINFPIYLWASKEVEDYVDDEEENVNEDNINFDEGSSKEALEDKEKEFEGTKDIPNAEKGE